MIMTKVVTEFKIQFELCKYLLPVIYIFIFVKIKLQLSHYHLFSHLSWKISLCHRDSIFIFFPGNTIFSCQIFSYCERDIFERFVIIYDFVKKMFVSYILKKIIYDLCDAYLCDAYFIKT